MWGKKQRRRVAAKKPLGQRIRRWWRICKWLTMLLLIALVGGWWYLQHISEWGERYFTSSFRWNVPSRIFSDVDYLYPGYNIAQRELRAKLDRLGYRDVGGPVQVPGDYAFSPTVIQIYLHDFDYPGNIFKGFPIQLTLDGAVVRQITQRDSGDVLSTVRLEPELIASIFDASMEDRTLVTLKEVPDACLQAVVLIEDVRFFKHHGVDPRGIVRAMWENIKAMRVVEGGSTLTQQLVKNYFLTDERAFSRKLNEALLALAIEQRHTKGEILEAYLNEIYLGQRGSSSVSGFGEAAKLYFAKNIDQLSVGECALLAGMIQAPSKYAPPTHPDAARDRRNFVLARLHNENLITDAQYGAGLTEAIVTPKVAQRVIRAPYFIDFVRTQLHELYPEERLRSEGLKIFTTLDMASQQLAEQVVAKNVGELEKTYAKKLPANRAGQLQGALISVQPQNGYVRALVGGRSYDDSKFNRVTQAQRQPGSTIKPFVYLTAFDASRTKTPIAPATIVRDVSFTVQSGGKPWTPKNYEPEEMGPVPASEALMKSLNVATARLAIDTGLEAIVKTLRDAGMHSPVNAVPSLALGAFEVAPIEIAAMYSVFPNGGIRTEPLSITHVVTSAGEVIDRKAIAMERRFAAAPIYLVTSILKDVMNFGTAASSRRLGFTGIAAGKTGTTSNNRDAWFVGFTPDLLTLTWVGYDDNAPMNLTGSQAALPIWANYMTVAAGAAQQDFPAPKDIVLVKVDPMSGLAWTKNCPQGIFAPFIEGHEPREACPVHK